MTKIASVERNTKETQIKLTLTLDGTGQVVIQTGIGFFDHMLTLFTVHGLFNLDLSASGDLEVDFHHTVEDVGLSLGEAINVALGDRKGICRFGHAVVPMDESLAEVTVDLSRRPFLVFQPPRVDMMPEGFDFSLVKEFFQALSNTSGMNLHIRVPYGENGHHVIEAIFKAFARALSQAVQSNPRISGVLSSKGVL